MLRHLNRVLFVILSVVGLVALLPAFDVVDQATCETTIEAPPSASSSSSSSSDDGKTGSMKTVSLTVRAGDVEILNGVRDRVQAGLQTAGTAEIVDNPTTFPRATVTVTAIEGRWTPFWSKLKLTTSVVLDRDKPRRGDKGRDVERTVVVEGTCLGLVGRSSWRTPAVERTSTAVVEALSGR